jgi:guanylate kinase
MAEKPIVALAEKPMADSRKPKGPLIVLSGPSGSGKSTVIGKLLERGDLPLHLSVSATTRPKRPNEVAGKDYHYWTMDRFGEELVADGFLEHAKVVDHRYGTLKSEVEPYRDQGVGVILDVDTQGRLHVCTRCPDAISIFLYASSPKIYEERLRKRGTESEEAIQRRLANGLKELAHAPEYDYQVLNDHVDDAVRDVHRILTEAFARDDEHAR